MTMPIESGRAASATRESTEMSIESKGLQDDPARSRNLGETAFKGLHFAWLEITGKCPLQCSFCYAGSSPQGTHGTMTHQEWLQSIDQVRDAGAEMVQFIGGEPTMHPGLPEFVDRALNNDMKVEVYSNLAHVSDNLWQVFTQDGVQLATSYFSSDPAEHDAITMNRGSHARTKANIQLAIEKGVDLRVGLIHALNEQDTSEALDELLVMGIDSTNIGYDNVRGVGRGAHDQEKEPCLDELCGHCSDGVIAILPNGDVQPCVFSRWDALTVGNVQEMPLADILRSERFAQIQSDLVAGFAKRAIEMCRPGCSPHNGCAPIQCNPCAPATTERPRPKPRPRLTLENSAPQE